MLQDVKVIRFIDAVAAMATVDSRIKQEDIEAWGVDKRHNIQRYIQESR